MYSLKLLKNIKFTRFRLASTSSYSSYLIDKAYINGKWISPGGEPNQIINPSTGKPLGNAPNCTVDEVKLAIKYAKEAMKEWKRKTAKERSVLLRRLYELQVNQVEDLAMLISQEMGKPIRESRIEVNYGASFLEWFSEEARRINGQIFETTSKEKFTMYIREASGVAAIITPWNFPNAMITRKLGAALAAGCTTVIRPASSSPFSALAIAKLAEEAGFPPGVINVCPSSPSLASKIGSMVSASHDVAVVSFTGSTSVGEFLLANGASSIKRMALELGGNAPFIVFDSTNIEKAVQGALAAKFRNAGQTCICANRLFVQEGIHDEFVSAFAEAMKKNLVQGDATNEETTLGPLVNERAAQKVKEHLDDALKKGSKLILGGQKDKAFFEGTLITGANSKMLVSCEEIFGPLAAINKFKTEEEVLSMANDTRFGLAGYFYSQDLSQIWRVAKELEVGILGINEGLVSACEAPFGGVKESGFGREGSYLGIDDFTNVKYICLGGLKNVP